MRKFVFVAGSNQGAGGCSVKSGLVLMLATLVLAMNFACANGKDSLTNRGPERQSLPTPNSSGTPSTSNSATANTAGDQQDPFWAHAAESGMAEVELGNLASEKAQNPEVKKFAETMIADHGKANAELKALAAAQGVTLPSALAPAHQSEMTKFRSLSGAEFDKAYVDAMVAAHEKDVAMFQDKSLTAADTELKAFAAKTLPTLQKHLEAIKGIRSKLK